MLTHIHIWNFAIVEKLDLGIDAGLTVLTGETGAGKSILLDALNLALGDRADTITWRVADVTEVDLPDRTYDIWHDRAVFHFLTDAADRQKYAKQAGKAVKPGGYMIMATFGPEGPTQCSGLDVIRYAADDLEKIFGADFTLLESRLEDHQTPAGKTQQFIYALFQRKSD